MKVCFLGISELSYYAMIEFKPYCTGDRIIRHEEGPFVWLVEWDVQFRDNQAVGSVDPKKFSIFSYLVEINSSNRKGNSFFFVWSFVIRSYISMGHGRSINWKVFCFSYQNICFFLCAKNICTQYIWVNNFFFLTKNEFYNFVLYMY